MLPPTIPTRMGHHPQDGPCGHALAGAGFAHDAQGLTALQFKADAVYGFHHAGAREKVRLQILHAQDHVLCHPFTFLLKHTPVENAIALHGDPHRRQQWVSLRDVRAAQEA